MYPVLLVVVLNCIQAIQQNKSRTLRSIPDDTFTEKIIRMMDLHTIRQLSETSHHLNQMTKIQMNRFMVETAAHYQEAMDVLNLDVHQFMSQFPYLAGKANCALHHTFRSKGWVPPPLHALMETGERPVDFNGNDRFLHFHVQQINASPIGEWISNVRFLGFNIFNGQITGCILLSLPFRATFEYDAEKRRKILRSAFEQKKFKMGGRTWITSQHEHFREEDRRVRIFDYFVLHKPLTIAYMLAMLPCISCIGICLLAILYF